MFGFGKKKKKDSASMKPDGRQGLLGEELVAPVGGQYQMLSEVSDKVFASGLMGEGYAVIPHENTIVAPVSGELVLMQRTRRAFMIRTPDRAEVLVHIGTEPGEHKGRGFTVLTEPGQQVTAGQPIVDIDWMAANMVQPETEIMVMVTNKKDFGVRPIQDAARTVAAGEQVGNVER